MQIAIMDPKTGKWKTILDTVAQDVEIVRVRVGDDEYDITETVAGGLAIRIEPSEDGRPLSLDVSQDYGNRVLLSSLNT